MATFKHYFVLALICLSFVAECHGRSNDDDSWGLWSIAAGVGAVIAAPVVLPAMGFGAAGVAAGSLAAAIQGPAVVSGSAFALAQSAGAAGMAVTTKALLGTAVAGATYAAGKKNEDCDDD